MDDDKKCETCGATIQRTHPGRPGRFCSRACYNAAGRPLRRDKTRTSRMRRMPGHPIAPPSGTVAECRIVLFEKIGPGTHPCHWCKAGVTWMPGSGLATGALIADHLDWDVHNNAPDNLVPSCNTCNCHRTRTGGRAPIGEGELFVVRGGNRTRGVERFCTICGTPFVAAWSQVRIGRGVFCSRSCARRGPRRQA